MAIVYRAVNRENGHIYIGASSKALNVRRNQHHSDVRRGSKNRFHNAVRKYGEESFDWEIVCESDDLEAIFAAERQVIDACRKRLGNESCYNLSDGGEFGRLGCCPWNKGIPRTEELKQKLRIKQLGRKQSSETIEKRVRKIKGMKRSDKTKDRMSNTWLIETPEGQTLTIKNLKQFCLDQGLIFPCMIGVANGQRKQHKGYKCLRISKGSSSRN